MKNISARNKGLVTGTIMIVISICIFLIKKSFENGLQYIVYTTYVAGILWTIFTFKKETDNTATFKQYFAEGFKCFIVVTLMMVLFTLIFILLHPELKEQMAELLKAEYSKMKDITPLDIENRIAAAKKFFLPGYIMGAVLSYLVIGALITVVAAGFLSSNKTN
jgi:NADH:ubiquinone oxidoreductase subunit 6 (subunit J)